MSEGKRHQIMSAAEALFATRRFHEITMDEVAHRAGVGKGTIYRYFEDKDALFLEVARSGYDALHRAVVEACQSGETFLVQFRRACAGIAAFLERRHQVFHMMQAEDRRMLFQRGGAREEWLEHRRRVTDSVCGLLAKGCQEGSIRSDVPLEGLASLLMSMLRSRQHLGCGSGEVLTVDAIVDVFLNGAGATQEGSA